MVKSAEFYNIAGATFIIYQKYVRILRRLDRNLTEDRLNNEQTCNAIYQKLVKTLHTTFHKDGFSL